MRNAYWLDLERRPLVPASRRARPRVAYMRVGYARAVDLAGESVRGSDYQVHIADTRGASSSTAITTWASAFARPRSAAECSVVVASKV